VSEKYKDMVRHMVEAINAGEEDAAVGELFAPRAASRVKRLFAEFRSAFPDWREEIVELVAEGDAVAGRFKLRWHPPGRVLGRGPHGQTHGSGGGVLLAGGGWQVRGLLGTGGQPWPDAPAWTPALEERRVVGTDPYLVLRR
jgi:hypothetical protein